MPGCCRRAIASISRWNRSRAVLTIRNSGRTTLSATVRCKLVCSAGVDDAHAAEADAAQHPELAELPRLRRCVRRRLQDAHSPQPLEPGPDRRFLGLVLRQEVLQRRFPTLLESL